jgi:hypothetical protein
VLVVSRHAGYCTRRQRPAQPPAHSCCPRRTAARPTVRVVPFPRLGGAKRVRCSRLVLTCGGGRQRGGAAATGGGWQGGRHCTTQREQQATVACMRADCSSTLLPPNTFKSPCLPS